NLVTGDTNHKPDVFVRDRRLGVTERANVSSAGEQANGWSGSPSISADGRFVAFDSSSTNLVQGGQPGVFRRDRANGTTELVVPSGGGAAISADGGTIVFGVYSLNDGSSNV